VPTPASQPAARKETRETPPAAPVHEQRAHPIGPPKPEESGDSRLGRPRAQAPEPQIGTRRDAAPPAVFKRPAPVPAAPVGSAKPEPARETPAADRRPSAGREERGAVKSAPMPAAQVPWPEPDSVESEIVRALSSEPPQAGRAQAPAGKPASDPNTTLGDLAERLEEALAREVESASRTRSRSDVNLDSFAFDRDRPTEPPVAEPKVPPSQRERREPPKVIAAVPEPETRRDKGGAQEPQDGRRDRPAQPEQQEEAPVISLNARRREPVDPLEDEMARLLGELTGDTNRR
jgi:hypothetical protein